MGIEKGYNMGDNGTETWENIQGYEGLYQISNYGRIKQLERISVGMVQEEHMIPQTVNSQGNVTATLWKGNAPVEVQIDELVALHFIPNPEDKKQIRHKDGNLVNNSSKNLDWI